MIFRFRVTYEDHEETYRDIDIRPVHSFEDFHYAIQQSIAFDNSKSAKFYLSDDYWRKEREIASVNNGEKKTNTLSGNEKVKNIADFINGPHQKFIYVFDPEKEWTFTIELTKILNDEKKEYPYCSKVSGTAPKQYKTVNLPPPPEEEDDKIKEEPDDYINEVAEKNAKEKDEEEDTVPSAEEMDAEGGTESEDNPKDEEEGESSDGLTFDFDDEDLA